MKKRSTTAKERAARRSKRRNEPEAVIPVTMQNQSNNGEGIGTAEIPVAIQGSSESEPGTVIGRAEIPVTVHRSSRTIRGRGKRSRSESTLRVTPVVRRQQASQPTRKAKPAAPEISLDERRRGRAMRDPIVRAISKVMDVEQGTVRLAGQFSLAVIGAAESVVRFLLPSPAVARKAQEVSEFLPWPLDETVERATEWPGEEQAA